MDNAPNTPTLVDMAAPSLTASPASSPVSPASSPLPEHHLVKTHNGALMHLVHRQSMEPAVRSIERYDELISRHDEGLNDPNVTIVVHCENNQYNVPVKPLCQNSCFFRTKIHNAWRKDNTPVVSLNGMDPGGVELFIGWISKSAIRSGSAVNLRTYSYSLLFEAFILGENIQALPFQNDVMDIITSKMMAGHMLESCLPEMAYGRTPKGSPLRRVMIDAYVRDAAPIMVLAEEAQEFLNPEFLRDLCAALLTVRDETYKSGPRPYAEGPNHCPRYHNHDMEGGFRCAGRQFDVYNNPEGLSADQVTGGEEQRDHVSAELGASEAQRTDLNDQLRAYFQEYEANPHPNMATATSSATLSNGSNDLQPNRGSNSTAVPGAESISRGRPRFRQAAAHANASGTAMSPALAALSKSTLTPKARPRAKSKTPIPPEVKQEEYETPCPTSGSKKRKFGGKGMGSAEKPIQLD